MANMMHYEILRKGTWVWNKWRMENPKLIPDLSYSSISHENFEYINFSEVNLNHCSLQNANFNNANFSKANLKHCFIENLKCENTNFLECDFENSKIKYSQFYFSNFSYANLSNCLIRLCKINLSFLINTTFDNTIFESGILEGSTFLATSFKNTTFGSIQLGGNSFSFTNLNKIKNLDKVQVKSPCSVDFFTLKLSNLSKEFLLKIGLPENYINYLPDFYDESPLRLFPVFLSHSWANKEFAGKLYDALIKKGVLVWYDEKKLRAGDKIFERLTKAIDVYDKMILVCSKESLEESWWVDEEMNRIFKKERKYLREKKKNVSLLIPITIDDHIFKWEGAKGESIRDKVIGDFSEWEDDVKFEEALNELIEALNVDRGENFIASYL